AQNGTWQFVVYDDAGADVGVMISWSISFSAGGTCSFNVGNLPTLTINSTNPLICGVANQAITAPTYNCGSSLLTVSLDNVIIFNNVPSGGTFNITAALGTHTLRYDLSSSPCNAVFLNQTVIVNDGFPPTVTCPGNITINLDPGACSTNLNYVVTSSDNCPFPGPLGTLNTITAGGNGNAANGMVWFNINNLTTSNITVTQLGMNIANATTLNVYRKAGTHVGFETNAGAWTLVATGNANVGPFSGPFPGNGTITPCNVTFTVPPGLNGIALGMPGSASNYTNGNGTNQTFTDGTLTLTLGSTANTPFGAPFTPRVFNGYVKYQTLATMGTLVQTSGLPSGGAFPIGTTTNCFQVADAAGNLGTCCFNVTVNEFPFPSTTLACNDDVQISLDETCSAVIDASMILEGDVYGCFDDYIVEILQGGVYVPAILGPQHVGQTIQTRITDPATGNSCWGTVHVEDKIPPTIECRPVTILCGEALPTIPAPELVGYQNILITGLNDLVETNSFTYNFDFSYLPPATPVLDVDVRIKIDDHTFLPDLN
ncbi:MAG: HYR domain-containing protein, partial [Saprospiraceae bacterium]